MSVRKRQWLTAKGEPREAWIVSYADADGDRHIETFARKKDADARHAVVKVGVRSGIHVAASKSVSVTEAAESWIKASEANELEITTIDQYRQHARYHINPFIGTVKLCDLSVQAVRKFEDRLRAEGRSPVMIRKVLSSLGSIVADAQEQGLAARNAVRELRRNRRSKGQGREKRQKRKLEIGVDIPSPDEVKGILAHAKGRWRPLLLTAAFTGLRGSELRGLRWKDVDFTTNRIHIRQRADRYRKIGDPKSQSSHRAVPFGKFVANTLKEWKLACPHGELVFPNVKGGVEFHQHIVNRGLIPAQIDAGLTLDGKAKYTGLHSPRHFYASWCINRVKLGGLGLPPKEVQERLGHATISMTLDRYGHLFKGDDASELDAAEGELLRDINAT